MKRLLLVVVAIAGYAVVAALRPAPAAAWFQVCNKSDEKVYVAVEVDDFLSSYSAGWWNILPGECATPVSDDIDASSISLYAESTSHTWSGSNYYCVDPQDRFHYDDDQTDKTCPSGTKRGFRDVSTGSAKNYTDDLTL